MVITAVATGHAGRSCTRSSSGGSDHAVDEAGIVSATAWRVLDGLQLARDGGLSFSRRSVRVTVLKAVPSKSKPDCGEPLEPTIAAGIDLAKTHNAVAANNKI
jgi:hypothetical protein